MHNLRRNFERFCLRHQNWGIPNLMLVIAIGNLAVYLLQLIDPSNAVYNILTFQADKIASGQVWRLISYIFIPDTYNVFFLAIFLFFYYQIGKLLESHWGYFRFNLFYFTGVILTDVAAFILHGTATTYYLNLSLLLAFATMYPEAQFLLFFIIPLKAKYLAWFYLAYNAVVVIFGSFPYNLFPLIALLNYFLFFGSDIKNVFGIRGRPFRVGSSFHTKATAKQKHSGQPNANWADSYRNAAGQRPYHHKCTVCGRTDTDYPDLEFRYCSRCNGYYCYCMDHINNHVHIQ